MAKHLYLPKLANDANVKEPTQAGQWDKQGRRILRAISKGILVDGEAQVRGVSSVPDAWARPLIFYSAIRPGSPHPMRERMVQEWRGFMSLLALHEVQRHPVDFVPVPLVEGTFASALRHLSPSPVQLERGQTYEWQDIMMVRYDGIPVGALSPLTLVYTGADYQKGLKQTTLNLTDDEGYLSPPSHEDEKQYVAEWLQSLQVRLNNVLDLREKDENPDSLVVGAINGLIESWLEELEEELGSVDSPYVTMSSQPTELDTPWSALSKYRVYQQLLHPLERKEGQDVEHSDLLLRSKRSPESTVLVITQPLLEDRRIWRDKRLSHLGGDAAAAIDQFFGASSGHVIDNEDLSTYGAQWIRPELYFLTDVLVQARNSKPILTDSERDRNERVQHLMPFRPELFEYFGPEHIREMLNPTFDVDEKGITFSFELPVGDEVVTIKKYYRRKDPRAEEGTVREIAVPALDIFPNYLDEHWCRYYVFNGHRDNVVVKPIVYGDATIVAKEQKGDIHGNGAMRRVEIASITGKQAFPDALAVQSALDDKAFGVIVLGVPDRVPERLAHTWTVGIDFGTSNTNIYSRVEGEDKARPWTFDFPRYIRRLTTANDDERKQLLETFFLPDRAIDLPIATGLRIFEDGTKDHPILDYFAHFNSSYTPSPSVRTGLKWEREGARDTEYFLESLLILILIEVVSQRASQVRLRCSYPKAFSDNLLALFKGEWERVVKRVCTGDQRILDTKEAAGDKQKIEVLDMTFHKEGRASGAYFASPLTIESFMERADTAVAAICLDVGGGTTDISVWSRNEIVYDASVLLAGEQISNFLRKMPRLRELLFSSGAAVALDETKDQPSQFAARLNLILKSEEEQVREMLNRHGTQREITVLRQMLALEFTAITFYVAAVLKAADQEIRASSDRHHQPLLDSIASNGIAMHWGGNAAKLVTWIDFGTYSDQGIAAFMLNGVFFQALSDLGVEVSPDALKQRQSPGHKSEASGGLVVLKTGRLRASDSDGENPFAMSREASSSPSSSDDGMYAMDESGGDGGVVSGENIVLQDEAVQHFELLSEKKLYTNGRTEFDHTKLERLRRFVDIVNFFGVRKGVFTEDMKIDLGAYADLIQRRVRGHFVETETQKPGSRFIEPVFITQVKFLQKALIDEQR